jgi:hypothetical protein
VKELYKALLMAQQSFGPVIRNATNPAFKSRYADLGSVIETVSEALNDAGLVFLQPMGVGERGEPLIRTIIAHAESGESIEGVAPLVCKDPTNPQAVGGAVTYMRRYGLLSLLGLAPEDDDGNAASQGQGGATQSPSYPPSVKVSQGLLPRPASFQAPSGGGGTGGPSNGQFGLIRGLAREKGVDPDAEASKLFGVSSLDELTGGRGGTASQLIDHLQNHTTQVTTHFVIGGGDTNGWGDNPPGSSLSQPASAASEGMNKGATAYWIGRLENAQTMTQVDKIMDDAASRFGNGISDEFIAAIAAKTDQLMKRG